MINRPAHLRINRYDGTFVHAASPDGVDYTLCGDDICGDNISEKERWEPATHTHDKIDCARCICIIKYCKTVKPKELSI